MSAQRGSLDIGNGVCDGVCAGVDAFERAIDDMLRAGMRDNNLEAVLLGVVFSLCVRPVRGVLPLL